MNDSIKTIDVNSGNFASPMQKIFITSDTVVINENILYFNDIKNIEKSDFNPRDWKSIGIIISNIFLVSYTAWMLSLGIYISILLYIIMLLFTYFIIQKFRTDIYSYILVETEYGGYLVGVVSKKDAEMLLNINFKES